MKNNLKIKTNDILNAIKKQKTFINLKNTRDNHTLAQFLLSNGLISNYCFSLGRKNINLGLKYDLFNKPSISGFILNTSKKKNKQHAFLVKNASQIQRNFAINATVKGKSLLFWGRFR
jgi:ribosomal protein S8